MLPEPWKAIGERLAATPLEDRNDRFDDLIRDLPERDAISRAMAEVDPEGPRPEPSEGEGGDDIEGDGSWGMLRYGKRLPVEPFPDGVFPPDVERFHREVAHAIGCSPDFPAVAALTIASGAIGRSAALDLKESYLASSSLWAVIVGPPSDGKTPALKISAAPVRKIDAGLDAEYQMRLADWEAECKQIKENQNNNKGNAKEDDPPKPLPGRIDIDDATMEVIPIILSDNPRGLIMVRDELAALLTGMNQYKAGGKGNDRATLLKIWSGDAIKRDRVRNEDRVPIRCEHPSMSIIGGMTPDMLGELIDSKGRADGLMDRFLFTYPDPRPVPLWSTASVSNEIADAWDNVVQRLWNRNQPEPPVRPCAISVNPFPVSMTDKAAAAWVRLYNANSFEMSDPEFPPAMRGPWGKFREYAGRLALVLCLMEHAADPTTDPSAVPDCQEHHVENAWRLIAYFKSHAVRVHHAVSLGVSGPEAVAAKAIVDWLRKDTTTTFTERQVKRARTWIEPDALAKALSYLVTVNAIRPQEAAQPSARGGRPASPTYEVNPHLFD